MSDDVTPPAPLGAEMPTGVRFVGREGPVAANWIGPDHPVDADLDACVACGLCLPHCPTYRLTGDETASPRGRIAAMRAVADGLAEVDDTFSSFMDRCLVCRACEDVCPSHVPFGRMMEAARTEIEPRRVPGARLLRWLGLDVALPHPAVLRGAGLVQPLARMFLPRRLRALVPRTAAPLRWLPAERLPPAGVEARGTVAVLAGCVQDRWFHDVNLATVRVLARCGWRVIVPRAQRCCGALQAHNWRMDTARRIARRNTSAFTGADHVVVNAAGCGAHMAGYEDLAEGTSLPVRDVMAFLFDEGLGSDVRLAGDEETTVAYHDACHALRAQGIEDQPRSLLRAVPGVSVVDIAGGDRCCGAAGLYNVTEPGLSSELRRAKADAIGETGARIVASANPGCTMQLRAGLDELNASVRVVHPIEILDAAIARADAHSGPGVMP
jgi:glycolate oxidase iron-sulfur subunit